MKKKILTYMMTAMVMFGWVGVGTPITAYARLNLPDEWFQEIPEEGIDIQIHSFGTGETWIEHIDKGTPEQNAEGYIRRCRGIGMSDADILAGLQQQGLPTDALGVSSTSASSSNGNATSSTGVAQTAPMKPTYTQEQIDAAWEEAERTESTCVVAGSVVYKNSLNGATKTEELPLVDHDYQETANVAATCTEDGHITTTCSICGDEQTKTVKATGHQAGSAVVAKQAGLFSEGESTVSCTACGELLSSEVLPQTCPLPLAAVIGIAVAAVAAIAGVVFAVVHKKKAAVAE